MRKNLHFWQDPPERPTGNNRTELRGGIERLQIWSNAGESCPEGTVPIRRTTEKDVLRASNIKRFGRKFRGRHVRRDSTGSGHEVSSSYFPFPPLFNGKFLKKPGEIFFISSIFLNYLDILSINFSTI